VGRKIFLIFALVAIAALIGLNVYLGRSRQAFLQPSQISPQTYQQTKTIIPPVEASEIKSMDSPDGKLTLLMKMTKGDNGVAYSFSVSGKEIFGKTVDPSVSFSIPFNTWSPNGKYVFLKEESTIGTRFFVLSAQVSSSDQNDKTADITDLFTKKYPDLKIKDVTGWGGVNLVIVNSIKNDGKRGPSFCFEMPGRYFTQLSMRF
jgi:hypothetical protein